MLFRYKSLVIYLISPSRICTLKSDLLIFFFFCSVISKRSHLKDQLEDSAEEVNYCIRNRASPVADVTHIDGDIGAIKLMCKS